MDKTSENKNSNLAPQNSDSAPAAKPAPKKKSLLRRILSKILALFIATFVALLLVEIMLRIFSPQILAPAIEDSMFGIRCIRPGMSGRNCVPGSFDEYVTTSPQRFRGSEVYQQTPLAGALRIAMIGDSFTFGVGASDGADYPARTKAYLLERAKSIKEAPPIEVINAGCGGTATGTQAVWFEKYVSQFHPSLVIISVNYGDIDEDNMLGIFQPTADGSVAPRSTAELVEADKKLARIRNFAVSIPGYSYLATHSHLVGLLRKSASGALWQKRAAAFGGEEEKKSAGNNAPCSQATDSKESAASKAVENVSGCGGNIINAKGIAMQAAELLWLKDKVEKSGAKLVIVFLPVRDAIYPTTGPGADYARKMSDEVSASLSQLTKANGIAFIDLTEQTREFAKTSPKELYHTGMDTHPNSTGYDFFGQRVADFLVSNGMIAPAIVKK